MNSNGAVSVRSRPAGPADDHDRHDTGGLPAVRTGQPPGGGAAGARVRSFGELELAIMDLAWTVPHPVGPGEARERLRPSRALAYTTVLTVMTRLHAKGWLARRKDGRAYHYWPTTSRAEYAAGLMSEALAIGGNDAATLARFAELLGPGGLEQLRHLAGSPDSPRLAARPDGADCNLCRRTVTTA